jgi:hypothetical protein
VTRPPTDPTPEAQGDTPIQAEPRDEEARNHGPWVYTTDYCEQHQIPHMCNRFAGFGWETMQVLPVDPASVKIPDSIYADDTAPLRDAHRPYMILFRRPYLPESD